ncbi:MAG: septal ring lytic transglycosylase RlpA family protein [Betaproteobacteria bacterium]
MSAPAARRPLTLALLGALVLVLAACSSSPTRTASREPGAQASGRSQSNTGKYYRDDGPGDNPPDLDRIADAQPRREPLHRFANNPYQVFGRDYVPVRLVSGFRQRGVGSWYGRRYHGQKTSSGETYDMYAMTAAHPTLPIPSYVRVTSVANGRSVVVRINDRGPFLSERIIDLSYVAAYKLGYVQAGSTLVEVEGLPADGSQQALVVPPPRRIFAPPAQIQAAPAAPVQAVAPAQVQTAAFDSAPPPPAQAPPQEAPPLPVSSDARGVYLQLGAFSMRDNAETFRVRVYRELAWLNESVQVNAQGGLFRLQLGPYASQDEARQMAERIRAGLNLQPVLLVR